MPTNSDRIAIRIYSEDDYSSIMALSPDLADVAKLGWHSKEAVRKFQDAYIQEMLAHQNAVKAKTWVAVAADHVVGFVHVREHEDSISQEVCATIPLLAVSATFRGSGVGQKLMQVAENWAKAEGFRLLHLEVFANNTNAKRFYDKLGFMSETVAMIKPLDR